MPDTSSNQFWQNIANMQMYEAFELRSHRFRKEMLPVFYAWLGIAPESQVLDGGCGSGVFTRYLAVGLTTGHITGFDINPYAISSGKEKLKEMKLSEKVTLELADGFNLPYADASFDAVTNYTYIGALSDREAGLKELIRICRPGGVVSCVVATNSIPQMHWQGSYPFDGADELQRLAVRENKIFSEARRMPDGNPCGELPLFKALGLEEIHLYPFSHLICYNDANFPAEYRRKLALDETTEEINWLKSRFSEHESFYKEHGFSEDDFKRLIALHERKLDYLTQHFDTDESYEWNGGFNFVVTGRKPG